MSADPKNSFTPQQREAIDGRGNLLVVAGAGTGKTRTLVARCLRLIAQGASFENILMVTFTEAAAAEMRARIRSDLQKLRDSRTDDEHLAQQLALLDTARISTLHSFCLQLAREHFHELGLDPQFGVLDEQQTRPLMRLTLDDLLESHYAADGVASKAVKSLILRVGRGSDARIRKLILKLYQYSQSLPDPAGWLNDQQKRFEKSSPDEWRDWFVAAVSSLRDEWFDRLAEYADAAPAIKPCSAALQQLLAKPSWADAEKFLRAIQAADCDENWPRGSKGTVRTPLKGFFEDAGFLASLLPNEKGDDALAQDWEWSRHHLLTLISLVREFAAEFSRAKRELGGVDFSDLEQCALRLLLDPAGVPTPTALEWRARLEHVFVDEYQDINAAQDAILTALSRDGKDANRFMVGDVKQSIYRFRRANPHIFSAYAARWSKPGNGGQRIPLTENFRSREALLNFINPLFNSLMREEVGGVAYEPLQFGAPKERAALSAKSTKSLVTEFHLIARADEESVDEESESADDDDKVVPDLLATEREARLIARRLRELKENGQPIWDDKTKSFRPVQWGDMAVLLRSPTGRAEAFAMEFSRAGVPLAAARDGFFDSLEVYDLINLLKLLDNPLQDVPLAAVLRSPLVGLTLDELAAIRASSSITPFWTALVKWRSDAKSSPSMEIFNKVNGFLDQFDRWRLLVRQSSLSQCLETALVETHYEDLLLAGERGAERVANVRRLLDLARQFDPYQRQGLYRFLRFVQAQEDEELDLQPAAPVIGDAVQLMSVHKSKGLEFPVVALAGLGTLFNEQDFNDPVLLSEQFGLAPKVTPPDAEQSYSSLPHWLARRAEKRELRGEELRLLYVALTRARDQLILVGTANKKVAGVVWESVTESSISTAEVTAARSQLDWLLKWLPQGTTEADWQDERSGANALLSWKIYDDTDSVFADTRSTVQPDLSAPPVVEPDAALIEALKSRLAWTYPFAAATTEAAKTSVTAVRRRAADEVDEESVKLFDARPRRARPNPSGNGHKHLSAAERGLAHHRFLQLIELEQAGSIVGLRAEAERLRQTNQLSLEQVGALNFNSIAAFWSSKTGQMIREEPLRVKRELEFTSRFAPDELSAVIGQASVPDLQNEFIVVQGTADLVVLLEKEIWLLDFKTDAMTKREIGEKTRLYTPQLNLYALALERIYDRKVTNRWLHFLDCDETVSLDT